MTEIRNEQMSSERELTPVDVSALCYEGFGLCGCAEFGSAVEEILGLLNWCGERERPSYATLYYGNAGVYYLLAGTLDRLGLIEHGVSIRYPWLTPKGEALLRALQVMSIKDIEGADEEEDL